MKGKHTMSYEIHHGDCLDEISKIEKNFVDFVVIDPPYGIDVMNAGWDDEKIEKLQTKSKEGPSKSIVKNIPVGMKFNPNNAKKLEKFLTKVAGSLFEVLKPGGFCIVFSQPRAAHRVAMAFENASFEIRDQLIWNYGAGQGKAQGVQNFIRKNKNLNDEEKEKLIARLEGLKTPQLTPVFETMWLCQKPKDGTFVNNYLKYNVGLVNFKEKTYRVSFEHRKPNKQERMLAGKHPTLKPVSLIEDLINVFCPENGYVLDCFSGSGTTGIAALKQNRSFIGIEKSLKWYGVMNDRLVNEQAKRKIQICLD